jgi:hypothetical protein
MAKKEFARPRTKKLDQEAVAEFLTCIGFQTEKISQEWRHLTAFGIFEGREAVFKLATTVAIGLYTQNEFNWNEAIHLIAEEQRPSFTVPQNFSSGYYNTLFYFIAQKFSGEPLAQSHSPLSHHAKNRLPQIAAMTREIELLPIPQDSLFFKTHTQYAKTQTLIGQKLLRSATEWASEVPRDLDEFLKVIEASQNTLRNAPAHGDFVIRQMFDVEGKIGLIDGEHAGLGGAYHYDVAQFYLRLRNDHQAIEEATHYLRSFYELLPPAEKETFWQELKPPLTQRYIGDLWGAAKNSRKLEQLEQLGKEILEDRVL